MDSDMYPRVPVVTLCPTTLDVLHVAVYMIFMCVMIICMFYFGYKSRDNLYLYPLAFKHIGRTLCYYLSLCTGKRISTERIISLFLPITWTSASNRLIYKVKAKTKTPLCIKAWIREDLNGRSYK